MPRIELFQQRTSPSVGLNLARANESDATAVSQAAGMVGRALGNSAQDMLTVRELDQRQAEEKGAVWANEQAMNNRSEWTTKLPQMMDEAPEDAADFSKNALKDFDASTSKLLENAPTPQARTRLQQNLSQQRLELQEQSEKFQRERGVTFKIDGTQRALDAAMNTTRVRPDDFQRLAAEHDAAVQSAGFTPKVSADIREKSYRSLAGASVEGQIDRDPYATLKDLNSENPTNSAVRALNFEQRDHLRLKAETEIRTRESEARANMALAREDIGNQMQDMRAAAAYGQIITQLPDKKPVLAAYGPEKGARLYQSMQDLQKLSLKAHDLNQMTTDQIQQTMAEQLPKGQQGAAEQASLSQTFNHLASQVLSERKQNPVGYLQQVSPTVSQTTQSLAQNEDGSGQAYFNSVEAEKSRLGITSPDVFAPNIPPGGSEWQRAAILATDKYKQVPKDAATWAKSALRSQDPKTVASAAGFLDALNNAVPGAFDDMRGTDKGYAGLVAQMVNAGAPADRAVQTAQEVVNAPKDVIDKRTKDYPKLAASNNSKLDSFLDEFDPGIFSSQPKASAALQGDFDRQTAAYFKQTGDIDLSRKLSWGDLRRVYGPTKVNGSNSSDARDRGFEVQAFPVERFGVDPKDVRKEIADTLTKFPQSDGSKPEDVTLVPDADTMREVDNALDGKPVRPSYRLLTKTGDYVRNDQGLPVRYFLPSQEDTIKMMQQKQAEIDQENVTNIGRARFARQQRLSKESNGDLDPSLQGMFDPRLQ